MLVQHAKLSSLHNLHIYIYIYYILYIYAYVCVHMCVCVCMSAFCSSKRKGNFCPKSHDIKFNDGNIDVNKYKYIKGKSYIRNDII